jgi:galactose mutarotase-like enzyme
MTKSGISTFEFRGWQIVRLTSPPLEIDIVPGKGGDILAVRWLPRELNLLWTSPWGLRERGAPPPGGDSVVNFLAHYPGGWQTIFPNGGDPTEVNGVEIGFHGEACLVPWDWQAIGQSEVTMTTRLHRLPFELQRRVAIEEATLRIVESAKNVGTTPQEVMWSHHPAFGSPLISGNSTIETSALRFVVDDERDMPAGDLQPGGVSEWPSGRSRTGDLLPLDRLPDERAPFDRFGYLTGFREGRASITNTEIGLRAELTWDVTIFPHAWYWLEAHATETYPWYGRAYVFAIEPASSYPGQGIEAVRHKTGTLLSFEPEESRTVWINLEVSEP